MPEDTVVMPSNQRAKNNVVPQDSSIQAPKRIPVLEQPA